MQYGQFQPIDGGETDQERSKRRNNTFATQIPKEYYTRNREQRTAPPNNTSQGMAGVHNVISFMGITRRMSVSLSGREEWRIWEVDSISDSWIIG